MRSPAGQLQLPACPAPGYGLLCRGRHSFVPPAQSGKLCVTAGPHSCCASLHAICGLRLNERGGCIQLLRLSPRTLHHHSLCFLCFPENPASGPRRPEQCNVVMMPAQAGLANHTHGLHGPGGLMNGRSGFKPVMLHQPVTTHGSTAIEQTHERVRVLWQCVYGFITTSGTSVHRL